MNDENKIENKIITLEQIKEVAKYMEDTKNEYRNLIEQDEEKNKDVPYDQQSYKYKAYGDKPTVEYRIHFTDDKTIRKEDYNWFIENLENNKKIESAHIYTYIYYSEKEAGAPSKDKSIRISVSFYEDSVDVSVSSNELEEETYKIHSYIRGILEGGEDRYNKTIKNRNLRIQSLCFSIGFALSYIVFLVLLILKGNMSEGLAKILFSKYAIILGQYFVAGVLGNMFGLPIMAVLYKDILPKRDSRWSSSAGKIVYTDDIKRYTKEDEVQINKFATAPQRREKIEKIFKITRIIVLVQVLISLLLVVVLK